MEPHVISFAILESTPATDTTETVRVQVTCEPSCRGFCHTVMQFNVPAAVVLPTESSKKGKKKDLPAVVVSDARDKAIRERVLWKVQAEIGRDVTKDLTVDALQDVTA